MIRLRSRVGPLHLRRRVVKDNEYVVEEFDWNFDNGFKCEVPEDWWEQQGQQWLDKTHNLRYKEALTPL